MDAMYVIIMYIIRYLKSLHCIGRPMFQCFNERNVAKFAHGSVPPLPSGNRQLTANSGVEFVDLCGRPPMLVVDCLHPRDDG